MGCEPHASKLLASRAHQPRCRAPWRECSPCRRWGIAHPRGVTPAGASPIPLEVRVKSMAPKRSSSRVMRRLAAAMLICDESAAFVRLFKSAARTKSANESISGSIQNSRRSSTRRGAFDASFALCATSPVCRYINLREDIWLYCGLSELLNCAFCDFPVSNKTHFPVSTTRCSADKPNLKIAFLN